MGCGRVKSTSIVAPVPAKKINMFLGMCKVDALERTVDVCDLVSFEVHVHLDGMECIKTEVLTGAKGFI